MKQFRVLATAALAAFALSADVVAQTPTCRPNSTKACPPKPVPGSDRTITYGDPFKPDLRSSRSKLDDDNGWNVPKIKLDNDTTLGVGGLERKF